VRFFFAASSRTGVKSSYHKLNQEAWVQRGPNRCREPAKKQQNGAEPTWAGQQHGVLAAFSEKAVSTKDKKGFTTEGTEVHRGKHKQK
jgi:hypothetical protein